MYLFFPQYRLRYCITQMISSSRVTLYMAIVTVCFFEGSYSFWICFEYNAYIRQGSVRREIYYWDVGLLELPLVICSIGVITNVPAAWVMTGLRSFSLQQDWRLAGMCLTGKTCGVALPQLSSMRLTRWRWILDTLVCGIRPGKWLKHALSWSLARLLLIVPKWLQNSMIREPNGLSV